MTEIEARAQALHGALRRVHLCVLGGLAACALAIAWVADPEGDAGIGAADPRFTWAALALGLGSVLARRQAAAPRSGPRERLYASLLGMLLAGGVGLVGVALAWLQDEREAALLYVLGGAILALRPPPPPLGPGR